MARPRVSLAALMGLVVIVALGFAAVRNASRGVAAVMFLATLGLLSASVLLAVSGRGATRMAGLGFALFGGTYALACLAPWTPENSAMTAFLDDVVGYVSPSFTYTLLGHPFRGPGDVLTLNTSTGTMKIKNVTPYHQVGHCFIALAFASLGAVVGLFLAPRDVRRDID